MMVLTLVFVTHPLRQAVPESSCTTQLTPVECELTNPASNWQTTTTPRIEGSRITLPEDRSSTMCKWETGNAADEQWQCRWVTSTSQIMTHILCRVEYSVWFGLGRARVPGPNTRLELRIKPHVRTLCIKFYNGTELTQGHVSLSRLKNFNFIAAGGS